MMVSILIWFFIIAGILSLVVAGIGIGMFVGNSVDNLQPYHFILFSVVMFVIALSLLLLLLLNLLI